MSLKIKSIYWLLFILALIPVIFYPISVDLGQFLLGGKTIAIGKRIYVDFIDIKPPLCYYIFSVFYFISGNSEIIIRVIDVLIQLLVVSSIIKISQKVINNQFSGYIASLVYCLTYTSLQYYNTFQLETIISLPLIWLIYLSIVGKHKKHLIIIGILIGIIGGLKYTFAIIIFPIIIMEILKNEKSLKYLTVNILIIATSSIIVFAVTCLPFLDNQIRSEYFNIIEYVAKYNNRQIDDLIFTSLIYTYKNLIWNFSVFFLLSAGLSLFLLTKKYMRFSVNKKYILINLLIIIFLWISIIVEKKYFEYHFARLFLPLSLLSGLGLLYLYDIIKKIWLQKRILHKICILLVAISSIYFSIIPKYFQLLVIPYYYFSNTYLYDIHYELFENPIHFRVFQKEAASYISNHYDKKDKIFVMGIGANIIYLFVDSENYSRYSVSSFYFYNNAPESWRKDIYNEMNLSDYLVIEYKSRYPYFTRDNKSVIENIENRVSLSRLLHEKFVMEYENDQYRIYHKLK